MVLYKIITEYFTTSTTSIMFSKVGPTSDLMNLHDYFLFFLAFSFAR